MTALILAHDVIGRADAPHVIFFAHGILGSRNNWRSFAKRVVEAHPSWRAVIFDLRNHGESHGLPPPHTVQACAADVLALANAVGSPTVAVGHSYGGKVVLEVARRSPPSLRAAWVLDAPPGIRAFHEGREEIDRVIHAVAGVRLPIVSRKALVEELRARGLHEAICQWMTTNLKPLAELEGTADAGFGWRFDLAAMPEMLTSFGALDLWPFVESHRGDPRLVLVRGGRSDRWTDDDKARTVRAVARGSVVEHVLPDAGHWLHTDDPAGLFALLSPALRALEVPHV